MRYLPGRGFSLIETLVVIGVFSIIAIVISQSVSSTLVGSKKSDATATVRGELNYATSYIERHLRSAKSIPPASCTGSGSDTISYIDDSGQNASFSCRVDSSCSPSGVSYVASGADRLTSSQTVCITSCQFKCTQISKQPPTIEISLQGKNKGGSGAEDSVVDVKTSVTLRAY